MPYILENTTKIVSNYCKLEKQAKSCFQTSLRLENFLLRQKLRGKFLLKLNICAIVTVISAIDLINPH